MNKNAEVLKIAEKHLGQGGARFRKFAGLPSGAAWCNAFVDYVANEGGVASLFFNGKKETYCPHSIKWCDKNLAMIPLYLALPMDIIYFDWDRNGNPNHIGLVRERKSTSAIYTIEGNTNGGVVANKVRPSKYIQGIYRPHFKGSWKLGKLDEDGYFSYNSIANLQEALCMKPTGILDQATIKYWQRKIGATPDGYWGRNTSLKGQRFLIKQGCLGKGEDDGEWGKKSTIALQKWVNKMNGHTEVKKPSETKTEPPVATPKKETPKKKKEGKKYTGKFPEENNNQKIVNSMAYECCYPHGTPTKKYKYHGGKPKPEYKKTIDKGCPNHKKWKNKKQRVGACCDVLPCAVLGCIGIKIPKDLADQLVKMPKMTKVLKSNGHHTAKQFKAGDIVQRGRKDKSGHTWIVCELINGKKYVANAHYKKLNGTYAVMDAVVKNVIPSKWKYYKSYTVLGAVRKYYRVGDYGKDVLYIQKFLNWYGIKVKEDGYFGEKTKAAVQKFQTKEKMNPSGNVGVKTIQKMKAVKK